MTAESDSGGVCEDGEHAISWDSDAGESICVECGLAASEIVNKYGHSIS